MAGITGKITVTLSDGRKLIFEYDFDGLIALEEASGMKMPEVYAELQRLERTKGQPAMRLMRAIIYGGLQTNHPELSLKDAGNLILNEADAINKAFQALKGAHGPEGEEQEERGPAADDETDEDPSKQAAGTGVNS